MTDPARWSRVKDVFHAALERDPRDRAAFVLETCGADTMLKADVESLLHAHQEAGNFAEQPAILALSGAYADGAGSTLNRTFQPGDRIGSYEIVSFLAAGGMGEVYRAIDPALGRQVAIKVVSPLIAGDADRLVRFEREARVLAALNHPNIASIYAVEQSPADDGTLRRAIVMELVEGETLAEHIPRAGMVVNEALVITRQLIDAFDAAHDRGIVHRDLKPANVKITPQGTIKVLDFGLAKRHVVEHEGASSASDDRSEHSLTSNASAVFGTVAYMSPEQVRGEPTDKRTDIWSFGCVVFEMLSGRAPFRRATAPETMASILEREPDWEVLPAATPSGVRALLRHCLQKDRNRRLRDIADARVLIDGAGTDSVVPPDLGQHAAWRWERSAWLAAVIAVAAALAYVLLGGRARTSTPAEMRLHVPNPSASSYPTAVAISPDGEFIAFEATSNGRPLLWLRALASETPQPLAGTEGVLRPFWSPDSRSIAFLTDDGLLKRIDLPSGLVRTVAKAPYSRGGTWAANGTILFATGTGPMYRVSADGGEVSDVTRLLPGQTNHRFPHFLPDGDRFLFTAIGAADVSGVYLGAIGSPTAHRLSDAISMAVFAPPHHVLFARHGALWVQSLDSETPRLVGEPSVVAPRVLGHTTVVSLFTMSSSGSGRLAYRTDADARQLTWLDRSGRQIATLGDPDLAQPEHLRLSTDGSTLLLSRTVDGNTDVWAVDTTLGRLRRVTFGQAIEYAGVLSPNGRSIAFVTDEVAQKADIYLMQVEGGGAKPAVVATASHKNVYDWSPDGRFLIYGDQDARDLWLAAPTGKDKPLALTETPFDEDHARFSPDGRWIVYQSNETGRYEIYLQAISGRGVKRRISAGGGTNPEWRRDGKELFYRSADNRIMALPVTGSGASLAAGEPNALFSLPKVNFRFPYVVSPDGQRFLINRIVSEAAPITVLFNWKPPAPRR